MRNYQLYDSYVRKVISDIWILDNPIAGSFRNRKRKNTFDVVIPRFARRNCKEKKNGGLEINPTPGDRMTRSTFFDKEQACARKTVEHPFSVLLRELLLLNLCASRNLVYDIIGGTKVENSCSLVTYFMTCDQNEQFVIVVKFLFCRIFPRQM